MIPIIFQRTDFVVDSNLNCRDSDLNHEPEPIDSTWTANSGLISWVYLCDLGWLEAWIGHNLRWLLLAKMITSIQKFKPTLSSFEQIWTDSSYHKWLFISTSNLLWMWNVRRKYLLLFLRQMWNQLGIRVGWMKIYSESEFAEVKSIRNQSWPKWNWNLSWLK